MLDEKDIQLLRGLFHDSEARMTAYIDERIDARIKESEARMTAYIDERIKESEARMTAYIDERIKESESRMLAYIEVNVMPKFDVLADGHKLLTETMASARRVDELEEKVTFLDHMVMSLTRDVAELKKAQ